VRSLRRFHAFRPAPTGNHQPGEHMAKQKQGKKPGKGGKPPKTPSY
jgi:hypothetical protein